MANIKQQKKRILQAEKAHARNKAVRSEVKTRVRRVNEAVAEGDVDRAEDAARIAQKSLGVAARKGILHKNAAARRQSRVATQLNRSRSSQG